MAWRVDQVKIPILATGCNKPSKGFTLIEILVVLVVIGIATSLVVLNFSAVASTSNKSASFSKTFDYLMEESIVTGNIIGWHADNKEDFSYFLDIKGSISKKSLESHPSIWKKYSGYRKTFKSFDGSILELDDKVPVIPLLIFYPSGENSGGIINIFLNDHVQEILINSNGEIEISVISY